MDTLTLRETVKLAFTQEAKAVQAELANDRALANQIRTANDQTLAGIREIAPVDDSQRFHWVS